MITVEVNGVKELLADLKALPQKLEKDVILRMSQIAFDSADRGADRHTKTGALRRSLTNKPSPGGRTVGHNTTQAPQAVFVNFGTRSHEIMPKTKKALRWAGPNGFIFAKVVPNHPGYIGDNYITRAKDDALAKFETIVSAVLKESL